MTGGDGPVSAVTELDVMRHHIYLIGYRGTGKSTVAGQLAEKLACGYVDTDRMVCDHEKRAIADIVAAEGWDAFRRLEKKMLDEAARGPEMVVATGGGAVLHRKVWSRIGPKGFVVWLSADLATLAKRLSRHGGRDQGRPSLTGAGIDKEIAQVLAERLPLYRQLADLEVDTAAMTVDEVVETIVAAYRKRYTEGEK